MEERDPNLLFFKRLCIILSACLLLVACQPVSTPSIAPTPSIFPSEIHITVTPTASQTPQPATSTLTPTANVRVYKTQAVGKEAFPNLTRVAAISRTQVAQTISANEATLSAHYHLTETAIIRAIVATVTPNVIQSLRSQNGKRLAQVIQYGGCPQGLSEKQEEGYEVLKIGDQVIETQHYQCQAPGAYGLAGKFWSPDSRFFYYTNTREGWPDGGYPWRRPISRYDMETGKIEALYDAAFSPDQRMVAGEQGTELVVWEVGSDTAQRFSNVPAIPDTWAIWAAWSPDGRGLAYLTQTYCHDAYPCPTTLILSKVDIKTWEQTQLLVRLNQQPIYTVDWFTPDMLTLKGADYSSLELFDLKQNTLSLVTLTPTLMSSKTPTP